MTMTEPLFQKILVASDGSERNRAAVLEALRIGRACGAMVYAVYVEDLSVFDAASPDLVIGDSWAVVEREDADTLTWIRDMADGVNLDTVTLEGKPAAEIVKFAAEKDVDLIVIGTQGKRGLERLLLGSVAESVIRTAPCRVLVVK